MDLGNNSTLIALLFLGFLINLVENHTCLLKKSTRSTSTRWSLPKEEICRCRSVYAVFVMRSCPVVQTQHLYFVDDPKELTSPQNWNKEDLDRLLNRTTICNWNMIFKAVADIADVNETDPLKYDPYQAWISKTPINENVPDANKLDDSFKGHYKNLLLEQHLETVSKIKFGLYSSNGSELMHMLFNATGADRDSWFAKDRLLWAPYTDITTRPVFNFTIKGFSNRYTTRRWYVESNHGGCQNDRGWLAVISSMTTGCDWERFNSTKPTFIYNKNTTYLNWRHGGNDVGTAQILSIFAMF